MINTPQTLSEFLSLTSKERKIKAAFDSLLISFESEKLESTRQEIINNITNYNLNIITITKLAEHSALFFNFLHQSELQNLWQEIWGLMGASSLPLTNIFRSNHNMLSQKNINTISLIIGYVYYQKALEVRKLTGKKFTSIELDFLSKAETYHSFHAMNALNKHDLEQLKIFTRTKSNHENIEKIINRAKSSAYYHGTPGFIILAETYYAIAEYNHAINNNNGITAALILAIQSLKLAELNSEVSQSAINNAYFGKGIIASNSYGLESIDSIKKFIIKNAGKYLNKENIIYAQNEAVFLMQR